MAWQVAQHRCVGNSDTRGDVWRCKPRAGLGEQEGAGKRWTGTGLPGVIRNLRAQALVGKNICISLH